jgi:hypothetical protein
MKLLSSSVEIMAMVQSKRWLIIISIFLLLTISIAIVKVQSMRKAENKSFAKKNGKFGMI